MLVEPTWFRMVQCLASSREYSISELCADRRRTRARPSEPVPPKIRMRSSVSGNNTWWACTVLIPGSEPASCEDDGARVRAIGRCAPRSVGYQVIRHKHKGNGGI